MISDNKVKLQISITKELNGWMDEIIKFSQNTKTRLTKSQLIEIAVREVICKNAKEN